MKSYQDTNGLDNVEVKLLQGAFEILQYFLVLWNRNAEHMSQVNQVQHLSPFSCFLIYVDR